MVLPPTSDALRKNPMEKRGSSDSSAFKVTETTTEARQAVSGHGVRYVLSWGVAGLLIAFAIVLVVFFWR